MKKKWIIAVVIIAVVGLLGGAYLLNAGGVKTAVDNKVNQYKAEGAKQKLAQKEDSSLTRKLKSEKQIQNGKIYTQGNMAFAAIVVKNGVSQADATAIANRYANELKAKYKDKKVNVQVVSAGQGKNLANITLE